MDSWLEQDRVWSQNPRRGDSWRTFAGAAGIIAALAAIGGWIALSFLQEGKRVDRSIVQLALLRPPPPAIPPPPKEKPPEPKVEREIPIPQPKPREAPKTQERVAPPAGQPALDTDRTGSGGAYDLGARLGGKDITIGDDAGGSRARFAWFYGRVQDEVQKYLQEHERLRLINYRAVVSVWFNPDGSVARFQLSGSSGDAEVDRELSSAMSAMPRMQQPPPQDLPQPLKLRITSHGAG